MKVILAGRWGLCFGVRDALETALQVERPVEVTVQGELAHNPLVARRLAERGLAQQAEGAREELPATARVLITAHGISERERARLETAGKGLIDTTCPLVRQAHAAAQALAAEGRLVVVLGKRGHVEVEGIVGDLPAGRFVVVGGEKEVEAWPEERIGVMCQTTTAGSEAARALRAIRQKHRWADVRFIDTICEPTKARQRALEVLMGQVDMMVVVGGRGSNNARQLVETCLRGGVPAVQVERAEEMRPEWFAGVEAVGLTAGTSTLPETVEEVRQWLMEARGAGPGDRVSEEVNGHG